MKMFNVEKSMINEALFILSLNKYLPQEINNSKIQYSVTIYVDLV